MKKRQIIIIASLIVLVAFAVILVYFTGKTEICGPSVLGGPRNESKCDTSCNTDNDCTFVCGCGAINKYEVCNIGNAQIDCEAILDVQCIKGECTELTEQSPALNNSENTLNINSQKMEIKSVFENNSEIPEKYTCDGDNISPPLEITGFPAGTQTLALVVDDPDAPSGTWTHWVVWNIPAEGDSAEIKEGQNPGTQGTTTSKTTSYSGPCPPSGTHRYFFKVYALDSQLDLKQGASKKQLESAMQEHILDSAELIGLYSRN